VEERVAMARTLFICGTACFLGALALTLYTVRQSASIHIAELQETRIRSEAAAKAGTAVPQPVTVWEKPETLSLVTWATLLAGFGMVAIGVRLGTTPPPLPPEFLWRDPGPHPPDR
jgi:hypothetical protein